MNKLTPRKLISIALTLLFLISSFITFYSPTIEAASFSTNYDITFTLKSDGSAQVNQKISLKNLTADLFASQYSLDIGSTQISNISGVDSSGSIQVTSKEQKDSTIINAKLNDKVIGKNKKVNFTLNYTIKNLAVKKGNIWDVLVPGISTSEKLDVFTLKINAPKSFGEAYSIFPPPKKETANKQFNIYTFDKKQDPTETIVASFGKFQVIEFTFIHNIKNSNFFSTDERIIIPRESPFQEVFYSEMNPRPNNIEIDADGNYLAVYSLKAGEEKVVSIKGFARIDKNFAEKYSSLETTELSTNAEKFWQKDSETINKQVGDLKDVRAINQFVIGALSFNSKKIDENIKNRKGAEFALIDKEGSLTSEFVDLFIAAARAKQIPTRQVVGFAFGGNEKIYPTVVNGDSSSKNLHTWVEYFDVENGIWKQADPTWEETSRVNYIDQFDANHFALFVRSSSSENPKIPEIFTEGTSSGTFEVKTVSNNFDFDFKPEITLEISDVVSGFPSSGRVIIKNETGKSFRGAKLELSASLLSFIGEDVKEIGTILPYSEYVINFKVRSGSLFKTEKGKLEVKLLGLDRGVEKSFNTSKEVVIKPFFSFNLPQIILILLLFVVLAGLSYPIYKKFRKVD